MRFWTRLLIVSIAALLALSWVLTAGSSPAQKSAVAGKLLVSQDKQEQLDYFALRDRVAAGEQLTLSEKQRYQQLVDELFPQRGGESPLDNQGGPDAFGYFYMDNVAPDTATYEWIELRGDPQATWFNSWTSHDDGYSTVPGDIGFDFSFYGVAYTQFTATSNGQIEFGTPNASSYWTCLPQPTLGPMIMADMYDAHLDYGGMNGVDVVGYRNFGTYTVIEFDSIGRCCSAGTSNKFEAILYNTGRIKLQYGQQVLNGGTMGSVGIQDATGTTYLAYRCQTDGDGVSPLADGLAIWIFQAAGIPNQVGNLQGQVGGSNVTLTWVDPTTDTNGEPITIDNVQVWLGPVGTGTLLGTVNPGVQTYTHVGASDGFHTYNVRAYHNPFYGNPASLTILVGDFPWHPTDYEWEDISGVGTPIVACDDCNSGPLPLGFDFEYYDQTYNTVNVCSNGWLSFTATSNWLDVPCVPNAQEPNAALFVFADDMYPTTGQCMYYTDGDQFIVSWINCPHFSSGELYTYQVIISSSGSVTMNYQTIPISNSCEIGVENADGTDGLPVYCLGAGDFMPVDNSAIIFWEQSSYQTTVTGHVALDGGAGNITQVLVQSNGPGHPSANPNGSGNYTMDSVSIGNRRIIATLAGYVPDTLVLQVDSAGETGANLTLRRVDPPMPTGLTGTVNSATGVVTLDWDNSTDPLVDYYKVYRRLAGDVNWVLRHTNVVASTDHDTLTVAGIYQYAVSAVDDDVVPPVLESALTAPVQVLFGELPPVALTANGNFDDRVRLNWLAPGTPPEVEVFYDNGENSPDIDGIGWWGGLPSFGWMVAKFQGNGTLQITRLKMYFTAFATEGDPIEVGVFADDGAGMPTFTPMGVVDVNQEAPFDQFREFELNPPVMVTDGIFYVGARQMTANTLALGGDDVTPFINNTFMYSFDQTSWTPFEPGLIAIPMLRAFVIGDIGTGWVDPAPPTTSVGRSADVGPVAKFASHSGKTRPESLESSTTKVLPLPVLASKEQYSTLDTWARASRLFFRVPPHPPIVVTATPHGRPNPSSLDDVEFYKVFKDGTQIATPVSTTYDDVVTSAGENVPHTYWVRAHYDNNLDSDSSNHATGRANMAPGEPTALTGNPVGSTQMQLTWTDPTVNADNTPCVDLANVRVYREGTLIGTVAAGVHTYTDTPPAPDQFYTWTVAGIDEVPNLGAPSVGFVGAVTSPWETTDYDWVEINGNGTNSGLTQDDQNVGPFPLGFDIEYYGQTYSQIYICSNGWASFTSTDTRYFNSCLPDPQEPNTSLDILFDDLYLPSGGSVYYLADAQNDRFIIEWDHVPHISGIGIYTMEIIIGSNGSVIYQYNEVGSQDATVGVEDAGGTDASLQLYCMGDGPFVPANQTAVGFWAGPSGELQGLVRQFGTNAPLEGVRVGIMEGPEFTMTDATGFYSLPLDPGTYSVNYSRQGNCDSTITNILIEDNNATVRNMTLRSPAAQFSVTSVNQGTWPDHDISTTFQITNNGGQCALDFSISDTSAWLSTNPVSGSVPPNQSVDVTVNFTVAGLLPGHDYQSSLRVQHEATGSPYIIPVTLAISEDAPEPVTLPTEYALYQNYPNPFNATTSIRFDVPQESHVKVTLFNVMGQAVATVVDAQYQVGQHSISYDATDLPTGMYLIKMEAGSYTSMKKMMLLK